MLVLRLSRVGRKKYPVYRLLAQDSRRAPVGKFITRLGHYNPHTKKAELKKDEIQEFLKKGAQPSGAVVKLLQSQKIDMPKWAEANLIKRNRKPKAKGEGGDTEDQKKATEAKSTDTAEESNDIEDAPVEAEKVTEESEAKESETEAKEDKANSSADSAEPAKETDKDK